MSCCDTGRCIVEEPYDREPFKEPDCLLCGDDGVYLDWCTLEVRPCPCKENVDG
jgi:hypothetical protein